MLLTPVMSPDDLNAFLDRDFPELNAARRVYTVTAVAPGSATVACAAGPEHLRPGATVSGPTIMTLADITAWITILAHIGPSALTVTTHLSIDFLRKPEPGHLHGKGRLLKLGKRLAVASVDIDGEDEDQPFAFATATYSIPPR